MPSKVLTQDFVMGQLRLALIAVLAYGGGKGWFTPTDAGFITAIAGAFGPLLAPWIWSIFVNAGKINVASGSAAAAVANVEKTDPVSASVAAATIVKVLLVAFALSLFLAPSAFAQGRRPAVTGNIVKDIKTDLASKGITVPSVQAGAACDFNLFAALDPTNVVPDIQNCVSDASKPFLPDVQAALDSANAANDQPGIACLGPALAIVKAAVGTEGDATATPPVPAQRPGVILIFQKFREFVLSGGPSACKTWVSSTVAGAVPL